MTETRRPCILETIDSRGEYSCFARDYGGFCPFTTVEGLEKYKCRSGMGIKATPTNNGVKRMCQIVKQY